MKRSFSLLAMMLGIGGLLAAPAAAPSFRNDVQPILTKYGCNSGACHGAAAGKNGFKLSLRGFDDETDYLALTRQAAARRVNLAEPGRSLMLLKPTALLPHKGGKRFEVDSREFRILADWIANGAPGPSEKDARIQRIEIQPPAVTLKNGDAHQFKVTAHFSDGRSEDVTRWTKYTSADETVAQAGDTGQITVVNHGGGALAAWYMSRLAIATITVPYPNTVAPEIYTRAPRRNFIDDLVLGKLRELNLPPSARCTDAEFIRRAFLDTVGVLPTADETRAFTASAAPDKRDQLIESLFARPEFVDYWTYKWSDLFLVSTARLKKPAMWSFYGWLRNHVASNTRWDVLARQMITAQGSTLDNGSANFFVLHDDPKKVAENTVASFLAMSINCAQCHNHPMEQWTNNDYYGMASLFARVRRKDAGGEGHEIVFLETQGEIPQPLTGRPQPPRPLDAPALDPAAALDRRQPFADWLTHPDNPWFARAVANRVWANFFAEGLVESVDDMRRTNPASNEKLLAAVAAHLTKNHYDLRELMRAILQSETYQRSSIATPQNVADRRFYSRYYPRRLMAEVMLDTLSQVTGVPTEFKDYPKTWRAVQLPDANVESYFLSSFGRPKRETTCTCERVDDPSVGQMLHMANGKTLNDKLAAKDSNLSRLLAKKLPTARLVEELYLSALSRPPTAAELTAAAQSLDARDPREAAEDLLFALLTSKEFLFNH